MLRFIQTSKWAFLACFFLIACDPSSHPSSSSGKDSNDRETVDQHAGSEATWFKDVTHELGIHFVNLPAHEDPYFMPHSVGSGIAIIDVNQDGLMDLYCLRMSSDTERAGNVLFVQQSNGAFKDQSKQYGLDLLGYFHGVGVGDMNNDGLDDLVLTEYQGIRVLQNTGEHQFEDITEASGVVNAAWGMSVTLADYDMDGWLDMVVANYVHYDASKICRDAKGRAEFCGPQQFSGASSRLFRNLGENTSGSPMRFEDVSLRSGLAMKPGPGLGVACLDFTGDGYVDLFFADDMKPNRLFVNQGDGTFKEEAGIRGISVDGMGQAKADMGIGIADVDRNGLFDVFITHLKTENHTLWMQEPAGVYTDKTLGAGLLNRAWKGTAFGTVMADFDTDGWPDLVMVNGAIRRNDFRDHVRREEIDPFWGDYAQRAQVYRNTAAGKFMDMSNANPDLTAFGDVGRGLAAVDLDNDGGMDLVMSPIGSPIRVFRNSAENRGNWIGIKATLPDQGGRMALGATIEVRSGTDVYKTVVNSGYSYLCANDPRAVVGLGDAQQYDELRITWPDRTMESFGSGPVNQYIEVQKGFGKGVQ